VFIQDEFEETGAGSFALRVSNDGIQVPLPLAQQRTSWREYKEDSPTGPKKAGLTHWRSASSGLVFKNADQSRGTHCKGANLKGSKEYVEINFKCEPFAEQEQASFKQQANYIASGALANNAAGHVQPVNGQFPPTPAPLRPGIIPGVGVQGSFSPAPGFILPYGTYLSPEFTSADNCGCSTSACNCNTVWQDCTNGCPYGFDCGSWNGWNYPYYAVTDNGFYGCATLDIRGYCSVAPYLYPYYSGGYYGKSLHDQIDEATTGLPEVVTDAAGGPWFRGS